MILATKAGLIVHELVATFAVTVPGNEPAPKYTSYDVAPAVDAQDTEVTGDEPA